MADNGLPADAGVAEARTRVAVRRLAEREDTEDRAYGALAMEGLRGEVGEANFHQGRRVLGQYLASLPADVRVRIVDARMNDGTLLLDDPASVRSLVSKAVGQMPTKPEEVDAELAQLKALMPDANSKYWKGPEADKLQLKYRLLVKAKGER